MIELKSPGTRADIVVALDLLVTLTPETTERWPGLTEAVHWLVDDIFWDERDVAESIGWTLRDEQEVAAIGAVLVPLLAVLDALGPCARSVTTAAGLIQLSMSATTGAGIAHAGCRVSVMFLVARTPRPYLPSTTRASARQPCETHFASSGVVRSA